MGTPLIGRRGAVCCPATLLPPLPGLLLAEAVGPAVCPVAIPAWMRGAGCADELLAARDPFYLFCVFWEVDLIRGAVHVGAGARVRFLEQQRHLLVDAVVFCDRGLRGRWRGAGGRWVHVLHKVVVERCG
jgi:hypothetical protein